MSLLKDKRALIWGGGSGIGFGCAEAMTASGARVFIASRSSDRLVKAAARLGGCGFAAGDATVEAEVAPWLHQYPRPGSSYHATALHSTPPAPVPPTGAYRPPVVLADVTDPATVARISAAVASWSEESNGQVEARVFQSDRPLDAADLSATLLISAGLESLEGATEADVRVWPIRPQDAFNFIFSAASGGGAYSQALYGAYGRLAAWQSLAGLTRLLNSTRPLPESLNVTASPGGTFSK